MSERLSLSRAARLVGVSRGVLQKQIRDGALATFEGKVSTDDLAHHFPSVSLEPTDPELARVNQIKEKAFGKRVFERALPDKEVLAARLAELGKDITRTRAELSHYQLVMQWLDDKLDELAEENNVLRSPLSALKTWLRRELAEAPEAAMVLEASESYRQVVAPHVRLTPSDDDFFVEGSETLLEAALRAGIAMNYGCSNGNCGCCKARMVSGQIKKVHPHDFVISEAEKNMGYALMCANTAVTDVVIDAGTAMGPKDLPFQQITAQVEEMAYPSDDVLILRLKTPRTSRLRFLAGQHVTLRLAALPPVNFTIASCPCEARRLEFHIRRALGNPFSDYVFHRLEKDTLVDVEGPSGEFVLRQKSTRPLLFIAGNSGFAPIKSLVEHAIALDRTESIALYWIGSSERDLYMRNRCRAWADALDNFHFTPFVADSANFLHEIERIATEYPQLTHADIYVAGPEALVGAALQVLPARGAVIEHLLTEAVY